MSDPRGDERPWGRWDTLHEEPGFKVKRILVKPGQRLSYQTHARRAEHWNVVRGRALVTLDGRSITLEAGQSVDIPLGAAHRVSNEGPGDLVFVEVQHGGYLGEDDIRRLDDDYGRAGGGA
ncbi:MAG: phosphomannose isomerase type II C-terminal cupin domain [Elusimicrobia bacterium]|nr:phosphomannose isomerase type II C-terminal cupin domain [Elusimicrobiota bacterium]